MKAFPTLRSAALGACLAAYATCGAAADLSQRFMCATLEAIDCEANQACFVGRPAEIGAPAFMRVDLEQKTIGGARLVTPIVSMERKGENLILQGTEIGYGWTLAVDMKAGKMAATIVNGQGAFVLFGACTPL